MKIEEREKGKITVDFFELNIGDTFLWNNDLFIKTNETSNGCVLSVRLDTGEGYALPDCGQVEEVECHLTYTKV